MSGITHGMDIAGVQAMGQAMGVAAGELTEIASAITAKLGSVEWKGADNERFKSAWDNYANQLNQIAEAVRAFGNHAVQEANQQEAASS